MPKLKNYRNKFNSMDEYKRKKMKYKTKDFKKPYTLAKGFYKNLPYIILNFGTHPAAFIGIKKIPSCIFENFDYKNLQIEIPKNAHLNYSSSNTKNMPNVRLPDEFLFFGWEYTFQYQVTTQEIYTHVMKAIDDFTKLIFFGEIIQKKTLQDVLTKIYTRLE